MGKRFFGVALLLCLGSSFWVGFSVRASSPANTTDVLNSLARALKAIAETPGPKKPSKGQPPTPPLSVLITDSDWKRMPLEAQAAYVSGKLKSVSHLHRWDRMLLNRRRGEVVAAIFAKTMREVLTLFGSSFEFGGVKIGTQFPNFADLSDLIIHYDHFMGAITDEDFRKALKQGQARMDCLMAFGNDSKSKNKACKALNCEQYDACMVGFFDDFIEVFSPLIDVAVGGYYVGGRPVVGLLEMVVSPVIKDPRVLENMRKASEALHKALELIENVRGMIVLVPEKLGTAFDKGFSQMTSLPSGISEPSDETIKFSTEETSFASVSSGTSSFAQVTPPPPSAVSGPEKVLTDSTTFLAAARDIMIDKKSGLLKASVLLPHSPLADYLANGAGSIFDLAISSGMLGIDIIKVGSADLDEILGRFECLEKSNEELKTQADAVCRVNGCLSKKACIASTIREVLKILRPFVYDFIGRISSLEKSKSGKITVNIERGILLSTETLMKLSLKLGHETGVYKVLGDSGADLFEKTEEKVVLVGRMTDFLTMFLNQALDGLELIALTVGGPDSIPNARKDLKELAKKQKVVISDDF
ncbi:TPA: hypothetical protein DDZ86_02070 [Candidatus Dependentiae bacterium]|nr:hypothetical protein [Candidatus Dependentiae bacterium]